MLLKQVKAMVENGQLTKAEHEQVLTQVRCDGCTLDNAGLWQGIIAAKPALLRKLILLVIAICAGLFSQALVAGNQHYSTGSIEGPLLYGYHTIDVQQVDL